MAAMCPAVESTRLHDRAVVAAALMREFNAPLCTAALAVRGLRGGCELDASVLHYASFSWRFPLEVAALARLAGVGLSTTTSRDSAPSKRDRFAHQF